MYSDIIGVQICLNEPTQNPLHRYALLIWDCVFCNCMFVYVCFVTVCFVQRVIDDYVFCDSVFCDSVFYSILFNRPGLLNGILLFCSEMEFT